MGPSNMSYFWFRVIFHFQNLYIDRIDLWFLLCSLSDFLFPASLVRPAGTQIFDAAIHLKSSDNEKQFKWKTCLKTYLFSKALKRWRIPPTFSLKKENHKQKQSHSHQTGYNRYKPL